MVHLSGEMGEGEIRKGRIQNSAIPFGNTFGEQNSKFGVADLIYEIDLFDNRNPCREAIYRVSTFQFRHKVGNAQNSKFKTHYSSLLTNH